MTFRLSASSLWPSPRVCELNGMPDSVMTSPAPRPEPETSPSDSDQGVYPFRPSASDRADALVGAGVTGMSPAPIYSPAFSASRKWGPQKTRAAHAVARIHFGPGIRPGGPSSVLCTCGVLIETKTAEDIYPAWVSHGGKRGSS
jgi:hypothetical protein